MSKTCSTALKSIHKANADYYRRLLHADLTDTERTLVERRLTQEQNAFRRAMLRSAPIERAHDAA